MLDIRNFSLKEQKRIFSAAAKEEIAKAHAAGYKEERIKNALRELSPFTVGKIADYHIDKIIAKARKSLNY